MGRKVYYKFRRYGLDFETALEHKESKIIYLPDEVPKDANKIDYQAKVILGAAISKRHKFIYDYTRDKEEKLTNFLFYSKFNKHMWVYNIGYDGRFLLDMLFREGFKEVEKLEDKEDEKNFVALKNIFGKIFKISWKIFINGKYYITHVQDTYNMFPHTSLDQGLKSFNVNGFDGKPLRKDSFNFSREDTYDENGLLSKKFILYCRKDAEGAYVLYRTLIKKAEAKRSPLTVGALAFNDLLKRDFGDKLKNFHKTFGEMTVEDDQYFRKYAYRGGYGVLNDKCYAKPIVNASKVDVVSMYPHLLKAVKHPIYEDHLQYDKYEPPTKERQVALHIITIDKAKIKKGYWPILIWGRKQFNYSPYLWGVNSPITIGLFEDYGIESEFSIFKRTYTGRWQVDRTYLFKTVEGVFDNFIDHWFDVKAKSKDDPPMYITSKLMLNAATGKIGENPRRAIAFYAFDSEKNLVVVERHDKFSEGTPRAVLTMAHITQAGRVKIWLEAEKIGFDKVLLIATDAIAYIDDDTYTPDEGPELGQYEYDYKKWEFLGVGEKMYQWRDPETGDVKTYANGIKQEVRDTLEFGELKTGLEFEMLKKQTFPGGTILVPQTLKLKERYLDNEGWFEDIDEENFYDD